MMSSIEMFSLSVRQALDINREQSTDREVRTSEATATSIDPTQVSECGAITEKGVEAETVDSKADTVTSKKSESWLLKIKSKLNRGSQTSPNIKMPAGQSPDVNSVAKSASGVTPSKDIVGKDIVASSYTTSIAEDWVEVGKDYKDDMAYAQLKEWAEKHLSADHREKVLLALDVKALTNENRCYHMGLLFIRHSRIVCRYKSQESLQFVGEQQKTAFNNQVLGSLAQLADLDQDVFREKFYARLIGVQ